jgi:hypothetical protein
MGTPKRIRELIERFERNRAAYHESAYNEAQVRVEFIAPFFEELGWDIHNRRGYAEPYKDVVHEYSLATASGTKAPDYSFRVGGVRKFFVEAKKPAVNLRTDPAPAFQLRRYAWSAKLPLSILTDFEEFAVYDCRVEPRKSDKAGTARVLYMTLNDYANQWDDLTEVFSRDAVLKGSFDQFAESARQKRGTSEVDVAFLEEIQSWREALARNLALRNPNLTTRELNFAVQQTIDRIVFLRICEDRGIEPYGQLGDLARSSDVYESLAILFHRADERYNSGLFHFKREQDRVEPPDELTLRLRIDDRVLKDIIGRLYYPESPYAFSVIGADILGQVYEQFLGKVIRLTSHHRAVVEWKPFVKKSAGVYYTPSYVVQYIVEQTLAQVLEGKTPRTASNIRILDPACGSGSFLIAAYQYLLDWHLEQYTSSRSSRRMYQGPGGDWRLTTAERKRILLNSLYGVDIDPQAVEVTKLSLLLKVLEGETEETLSAQLRLFHERALPDLANNIKCGNSLIGPDYFSRQQPSLLSDEEETLRVNAFDWVTEFPDVLKNGGFDVVLGNPPYVSVDRVWGKRDPRLAYLKTAFPDVYNDKSDILFYFLARAIELSRSEVGLIVSRAFLEAFKADKLRSWIGSHAIVREIIDLQNFYVFKGVGITTAIVLLGRRNGGPPAKFRRLRATSLPTRPRKEHFAEGRFFDTVEVDQERFQGTPWSFVDQEIEALLSKVDSQGEQVGDVLLVGQGMQTGRNDVFGGLPSSSPASWELSEEQYYVRARNSDIHRYLIEDSGEIVLYLEDVPRFSDLPSAVREHLKAHEAVLKSRAAYQRGDCEWWRYTWPLHKNHIRQAKLYAPYLATTNRFALDEAQRYLGLTDTTVLYDKGQQEDLRYFLALLNSRLLTFRFRYIGKLKSSGIMEYFWNSVSRLPIRRIDFTSKDDVTLHDELVELAMRRVALERKRRSARLSHEQASLNRMASATDNEIDGLVYKLYRLDNSEISLVEGRTGFEATLTAG